MTSQEAFAYALLLKAGDRTVQIMDLLEPGRREEIKTALETLKTVPPDSIRQMWGEGRESCL